MFDSLRYPKEPEFCLLHAESTMVGMRTLSNDAPLDYSVESLPDIDELISIMRRDQHTMDKATIETMIYSFGCYVGEVILRNTDATWIKEESNQFDWPVVNYKNHQLNPIAKAYKCFINGEEDSLTSFYRIFIESNAINFS